MKDDYLDYFYWGRKSQKDGEGPWWVLYPSGPLLEVLTYWCFLALQNLLAFCSWMVCRPLRSCRMLGRVLVSHCSPACLPIYPLTPRSQIHLPILMVPSTRPSYSLCSTSSTCRIHHSFPGHCHLPLLGVYLRFFEGVELSVVFPFVIAMYTHSNTKVFIFTWTTLSGYWLRDALCQSQGYIRYFKDLYCLYNCFGDTNGHY